MPLEQHFDLVAVATRLKLSVDQIRKLIESGQLEAVNVAALATGRACWRVPESAIGEFLKRRRSAPPLPATTPQTRRPRLAEVPRYFR